eukprot:CAMPEP_0185345932 /NCGR_PEP_ID=MMETSP1364-20130426/78_1 /TAXON_ID=38817 /ORGANISM="Gephyrocapsa oceanica, Strain RCC1303" /LENGTH=66 /DNA_ID=CAMNT_0027945167 /DNA_START=164 /DNA_END=365 /DNA_ORIENTATION=-
MHMEGGDGKGPGRGPATPYQRGGPSRAPMWAALTPRTAPTSGGGDAYLAVLAPLVAEGVLDAHLVA